MPGGMNEQLCLKRVSFFNYQTVSVSYGRVHYRDSFMPPTAWIKSSLVLSFFFPWLWWSNVTRDGCMSHRSSLVFSIRRGGIDLKLAYSIKWTTENLTESKARGVGTNQQMQNKVERKYGHQAERGFHRDRLNFASSKPAGTQHHFCFQNCRRWTHNCQSSLLFACLFSSWAFDSLADFSPPGCVLIRMVQESKKMDKIAPNRWKWSNFVNTFAKFVQNWL